MASEPAILEELTGRSHLGLTDFVQKLVNLANMANLYVFQFPLNQ